jgi:hypothetical protein
MLHDLTVIIFAMCEQEYFWPEVGYCCPCLSLFVSLTPVVSQTEETNFYIASLLLVPSSFRTPLFFSPLV